MSKGSAVSASGVNSVMGCRFKPAKSIRGFRFLTCNDAGIALCCRLNTTLTKPAMPDAVSKCPTLVLAEPIGRGLVRVCPSTLPKACVSSGSPTIVPVPCASR